MTDGRSAVRGVGRGVRREPVAVRDVGPVHPDRTPVRHGAGLRRQQRRGAAPRLPVAGAGAAGRWSGRRRVRPRRDSPPPDLGHHLRRRLRTRRRRRES